MLSRYSEQIVNDKIVNSTIKHKLSNKKIMFNVKQIEQ